MSDIKWLVETLRSLRRLAEIQRQATHYAYCIMQEEASECMRGSLGKWKSEIGGWRSFAKQPLFSDLEQEAASRKIFWEDGSRLDEPVDLASRGVLERQVVGAIRDAVNSHGPITKETANSAAKRVIGAIKTYNRKVRDG